MTAPLFRRRVATPPAVQLLEWTQHHRRIGGRWYRDAVVLVGGQRRLYSFPTEAAA